MYNAFTIDQGCNVVKVVTVLGHPRSAVLFSPGELGSFLDAWHLWQLPKHMQEPGDGNVSLKRLAACLGIFDHSCVHNQRELKASQELMEEFCYELVIGKTVEGDPRLQMTTDEPDVCIVVEF